LNKDYSDDYALPVGTLLLLTFIQVASHISHSPAWLSVFVLIICIYRFISERSFSRKAPFIIRTLLVCSSTSVFFLYYEKNFTVDMAASFLLLASALKLLEVRNPKDALIFIYTMLYLSAASFLFEQGILHTLLQIVMILISLYALLRMNSGLMYIGQMFALKQQWPVLAKVMLFSVPLVLICFLFFPRISPLWSIPIKNQSGVTGISDTMSPGDIANLAKSSGRAFRATFSNGIPKKKDLYWRGLVLDEFDGKTWRRAVTGGKSQQFYKIDSGLFYDLKGDFYSIMLEPSQQKWLFALEASRPSSSNIIKSDMGIFSLKTDATQATYYKMAFDPENSENSPENRLPILTQIGDKDRLKTPAYQDLELPSGGTNPRTQAYISGLQERFSDPYELLTYLMKSFTNESFYYTLKPKTLGKNFVDEFLFDTKQGFCSHYAGSLAYMLRLIGIPSRVVVGYQGGEYNEESDYLIVHQYDAHAWVEAKLPSRGWVRLDPTAMISPDRIMNGLESAISDSNDFLEGSPFASAMRSEILTWVRLRLDELNFNWQKMVVNYNQKEQYDLVTKLLGEYSLLKIALVFVYSFITVFILMACYIVLKPLYGKYTRAEKVYIVWTLVLARFGYKRKVGETPRVFLARVQAGGSPRIAEITKRKTMKLESDEYK